MPYPQRLLNGHEDVAVDLHPHWWYYSKPVIALVAGIVAGILTLAATEAGTNQRTVAAGVSLVLLAGSAMWLVVRYLKWVMTRFVITTDRLIFRTGLIAKRGVEIPLDRVNTVHFSQGIVERMLRTGDLIVESGGEDAQQCFTAMRRPAQVQRMIHAQIEENRRRGFALAGSTNGADVASQLERLEGMLHRGTINADEFRLQKNRLLDR
jgi:uncharacterized membrane protein YdbT with pleckstrin-like domain